MVLRYLTLAKLARKDRSLDRLASGDLLFGNAARAMLAVDSYSPATLDYITRKRKLIRASYFRQRYGRDYWTGQPRHTKVIVPCDPLDDFNYVGSRHHY